MKYTVILWQLEEEQEMVYKRQDRTFDFWAETNSEHNKNYLYKNAQLDGNRDGMRRENRELYIESSRRPNQTVTLYKQWERVSKESMQV